MRLLLIVPLMMSLNACADTLSNSDAVRDGTREVRREHARSLLGEDIGAMRDTGERLLTGLACGWNEDSCPH